jgi:hypothetical protein
MNIVVQRCKPWRAWIKLMDIIRIAYAKRPFAGPEQVLEYLGRYTHRVAITNNRILSIDNCHVTFTYRDRQDNNQRYEPQSKLRTQP